MTAFGRPFWSTLGFVTLLGAIFAAYDASRNRETLTYCCRLCAMEYEETKYYALGLPLLSTTRPARETTNSAIYVRLFNRPHDHDWEAQEIENISPYGKWRGARDDTLLSKARYPYSRYSLSMLNRIQIDDAGKAWQSHLIMIDSEHTDGWRRLTQSIDGHHSTPRTASQLYQRLTVPGWPGPRPHQ